MKKSNREINIFSMSTLDLFASAMGAFILITLVLFPYVLNTVDSEEGDSEDREAEIKAELAERLAEIKAEFAEREAEIKAQLKAQAKAQVEALQPQVPNIDGSKGGDSEERLAEVKSELEGQVEALKRQAEILQEQIDSTAILLGIRTRAKKFVFVVDMSGSMNLTAPVYRNRYPDGQDHRPSVILSIEALLVGFKTEMELAMIGFQDDGYIFTRWAVWHHWPGNKTYFRVNQNTRHRVMSQVKDWMGQVSGGTPTFEALREALALNPEEIILLTDGQPTGGQYGNNWRSIVNAITNLNTRKIPIHAVAIGDYLAQGDFVEFLVALTKRNDGALVGPKPG